MESALVIVISRWVHVLSAIVLLGGTLFVRFVLLPSSEEALDEERRLALRAAIASRWRTVVMVCSGLLLLSGFYNFLVLSVPRARDNRVYHPLFGVKFLLALCVFLLAAGMVGRSPAFEKLRRDPARWLGVLGVLGVSIVLISGALKSLF